MDRINAWMREHEFLLRRLHSLSGIVPVGFFLVEHLFTNSMAAYGRITFNEHIHWIHNLPYVLALEILFIFVPLAFHAIYGIVIAMTGSPNVNHYPYMDNWRYTLQRITGYIAFLFIMAHLIHFRFAFLFGGEQYMGAEDPWKLTVQGFVGSGWLPGWLIGLFYLTGTAAAVYHLCNGVVTFCITWGITVGDQARKRVGIGALGLGVVLMIWTVMSLGALMYPERVTEARAAQERPAVEAGATP